MTLGSDMGDAGAAVDRLFEALAQGDVNAARAACTPDAVFWHSYDQTPLDLEATCAGWRQFIAGFPERSFVDVRRTLTPFGLVQQHLMVGRLASGAQLGWPICIVVHVRDGRVARLEEYIDRSGHYPVEGAAVTTPGLIPWEAPRTRSR